VISKIRPLHLQEYYAKKLKTGLSNRSVQYHHTIIHKALKQAVRWQMIPYNPADGVQAPRPRRKEQSIIPSEKIPEFLMAIRSDHFYDLVYTALRTGMRRGELLGLRWEDVDLKEKAIHVVQSLRWVAGECHFEDVKTEHSRRSIPYTKGPGFVAYKAKNGTSSGKAAEG
jgi:integrase